MHIFERARALETHLHFDKQRMTIFPPSSLSLTFIYIPIVFNPTFTTKTTYLLLLLLLCAIFIFFAAASCRLNRSHHHRYLLSHMIILICSQLAACVGCSRASPVVVALSLQPFIFNRCRQFSRFVCVTDLISASLLHKDHQQFVDIVKI